MHTGQHWDPEMSQVFFDELGLPEPRYRLDLRTADPEAMTAADPRGRSSASGPTGCSSSATRTRRVAGARAAGEVPVAHVEAGPPQLRPVDARGAEPDRGRPAVGAALLPRRALGARSSSPRASAGRREVVGDVMADATRLFAPIARRASRRASTAPYTVLTIHREANTEPERLRRSSTRDRRPDARFVFPVHPRTRHVLERARTRDCAATSRRSSRSATSRCSRSSPAPTPSSPTRAACRRRRTGCACPCVTLRPNTEWVDTVAAGANRLAEPEELAAALADARVSRPTRPRSTATATPRNASQPPCTLERRARAAPLRRCRHRRRLRRRAARGDLRARPAAACCSSTCSRTSSTRSTAARATSRTSAPSGSLRSTEKGLVVATHGLRAGEARARGADRAPDTALAPARARPLLHRARRAEPRAGAAARPGRRARVDDVAGHDARDPAAAPRGGLGPEGRRGLPPRDVARARRPGPRGLDDEDDAEGRRRDQRGVDDRGRGRLSRARSTRCTRSRRPTQRS